MREPRLPGLGAPMLVDEDAPQAPAAPAAPPTSWMRTRPSSARGGPPITFAPGARTGFADVAGAAIDEAWYVENSMARTVALGEAYTRQIRQIYEATGQQLDNPVNDVDRSDAFPVLPFGLGQREPEGGWGLDAAIDRRRAKFDAEVAGLRASHPGKPLPTRTVLEEAIAIGQQAAARAADTRRRAAGPLEELGGSLAGGLMGSFGDPVQVATLPVGGSSRTIVGAFLKEAAVNAGLTGMLEVLPGKGKWRDELGVEYAFGDFAARVGTAAVFGGALGGGGKFGQQATGRLLFDRSAFEVIRTQYDALPANHPFRRDETLKRAMDDQAREYADRDAAPPGVDPDDHMAAMRQAQRAAMYPDAFNPPEGFPEPDIPDLARPDPARDELVALLDRGASAEDIWTTQLARDADLVTEDGAPTLRAGDPIPDGRVYHLPAEGGAAEAGPEGPREVGLDDAVDYLVDQARRGAGPEGPLQGRRAIIMVGYAGSGKSTFAERFAERARAAITDADEAKKVIPEYEGGTGTQRTANESRALRDEVVSRLVADGDNLIFGGTGRDPEGMIELARALAEQGYNVEAVHVRVDPDEAVRRSWRRALSTGRVIAPRIARQTYGALDAAWTRMIDSQAFSRYLDIDYSGPKSAAKVANQFEANSAGRGGGPADLAASGRSGAQDGSQGEARGLANWDLADEVALIAADARRTPAPPPPEPTASISSRMAASALGRAGDDPTPANLMAAAEEIERELGLFSEEDLGPEAGAGAGKPDKASPEKSNRAAPKEPPRLRAFLRAMGGLKDEAFGLRDRVDPGQGRIDRIFNTRGADPDVARVKAWEEGFFFGAEPPELQDFMDAVFDDLDDQSPRYRLSDFGAVDEWQAHLEAESAANNARPDDVAFSFAGPKAKGVKANILRTAKWMEGKGKTREEIWAETARLGEPWYKNDEGEWITERLDKELSIEAGGLGRADDVVRHPTLFRDYPQLAGWKIDMRPRRAEDPKKVAGFFRPVALPGGMRVRVVSGGRSTLAHELLGHGADHVEGRTYGVGKAYGKRPGERRAFNTEYRLNWSMEARIRRPPWTTEAQAVAWYLGSRDAAEAAAAQFVDHTLASTTDPDKPTTAREGDVNPFPSLPYEPKPNERPASRRDIEPDNRRQAGDDFEPGEEGISPDKLRSRPTDNDTYRYSRFGPALRGRTFLSAREIETKAKTDPTLRVLVDDDHVIDFDKPVGQQSSAVRDKLLHLMRDHKIGGIFARDQSILREAGYNDDGLFRGAEEEEFASQLENFDIDGEQSDILYEARLAGKSFADAMQDLRAWRIEYSSDAMAAELASPETGGVLQQFWNSLSTDPKDAMPAQVIQHLAAASTMGVSYSGSGMRVASVRLREIGINGGRFRSGFGVDSEQSLLIFDPAGPKIPITYGGRFYSMASEGDLAGLGAGASSADIRAAAVSAFGEGGDGIFDVVETAPAWMTLAEAATATAWTDKATGKVTLIADRVSADQVAGKVLHEVGAHHGMERILGTEVFADLLEAVEARAAGGEGPWAGVAKAIPDDTPEGMRAEEALGYFLERNAGEVFQESWWGTFKAAVQDWLATTFGIGKRAFTDADILELARGAVARRIAEGETSGSQDASRRAFSRAPQPPPGFGQPKAGAQQAAGPVTPEFARQRFLDALIKKRQGALENAMRGFRNGSGEADAGEFLQAVLSYQGQGNLAAEMSVDGLKTTITARSLANIESALSHFRTGVGGLRVNKADIENFVKEMFGEDSKDAAAKALAKAVAPELNELRKRFNRAGGAIGKLDNWGLPQSHDPLAIRNYIDAKGRAELKQRLYSSLATSRMRDVHTGMPMSAQQVWDSLDQVIEDLETDGWGRRNPARSAASPGMLANQRADHRYLVFRDAETWLAWQRDFGAGDPVVAMVSHIERMARDIAALEVLGPNQDATIEWLQQMALSEAGQARLKRAAMLPKRVTGRSDPAGYVRGKIKRMDDMWANYTGAINVPVNETLARNMAMTRNVLTANALGGAILSAAPTDPIFNGLARSFAGTSGGRAVKDLFRQIANPREAAQLALILDHSLSSFGDDARFAGRISGGGWSNVLTAQVMAMQGLTPWTRGVRQLFGMGFYADAGNRAGLAFNQLEPAFRRTFERYGISAADWDQMRAAPLHASGLMTPQNIEAHAGPQFADRYLAMILSETEYAVPSGTLRSRSFMRGRDQVGTLFGEVRQSGKMFLSFAATLPMLYGYRIAHLVNSGQAAKGAGFATAALVTTTVGGALAIQMKALAGGKDPQDMSDPAFLQAAALQGGGLGIYGDFLFGNLNRMDRGPGETLAGPVGGLFGDGLDLTAGNIAQAMAGEDSKAAQEWAQFAAQNVPFSSLWYLRLGYDRVVEDNLRQITDPDAEDSFRRRVKRLQSTTGQGYWWKPGRGGLWEGDRLGPERAPDLGAADVGGERDGLQ